MPTVVLCHNTSGIYINNYTKKNCIKNLEHIFLSGKTLHGKQLEQQMVVSQKTRIALPSISLTRLVDKMGRTVRVR